MDNKILSGNLKNVVKDSLVGLTCVNQETIIFEFGNVLVQKDYFEKQTVRIVSGGAVFFGEFVGKGMLTAAIQGETFMAPPSNVILRTIRELSLKHIKGVLIIVPSNTGDLLNFGLAMERALNDDINVKILPVNDDFYSSLPKMYKTGLTGVILVDKIAGAMSEKGNSLLEIFTYCEKVLKNLISSGISLTKFNKDVKTACNCHSGASEPQNKIAKPCNDIGIEICEQVIKDILNVNFDLDENHRKLNLKSQDKIVFLLNSNDGLSKVEQYIFVEEFTKILQRLEIRIQRFYVGNFLKCNRDTSLTVTVLKIFDDDVLGYLEYPCDAPGWYRVNQSLEYLTIDDRENTISGNLRRKDRLAPPIRGPKLGSRQANVLLLCMQYACEALISCEKQLNIIDTELGDGDTGTRLKNASEVLLKRMKTEKLVTNYPFTFLESLSKLLEATVGGTMGCIYSTLFEAAANCFGAFCDYDKITPLMWLKSLENACNSLKRYGNVNFGDGTMYDPIYACMKSVKEQLNAGRGFVEAFGKGVSSAEDVVQQTRKAKQKYPDSGAHAVGIWMRAVYEGVKLRCPIE